MFERLRVRIPAPHIRLVFTFICYIIVLLYLLAIEKTKNKQKMRPGMTHFKVYLQCVLKRASHRLTECFSSSNESPISLYPCKSMWIHSDAVQHRQLISQKAFTQAFQLKNIINFDVGTVCWELMVNGSKLLKDNIFGTKRLQQTQASSQVFSEKVLVRLSWQLPTFIARKSYLL